MNTDSRVRFGEGEPRFTFAEAAQMVHEQICAVQGHEILWIPMRCDWWPPAEFPRYSCVRCSVVVLLSWDGPSYDTWSLADARREALRDLCKQGHQVVWTPMRQPDREIPAAWFPCRVCDATIVVPHNQEPYKRKEGQR